MNKPANVTREHAVEIRFGQVGLVQVRIRTTDPGAILDELTGRIATAPRFFERTAVCLDLSALETSPDVAEVRGVIDAVRRAGMLSIGLTTGSLGVEALSSALQIPVLSHFRAQNQVVPVVQAAPPPPEAAGAPALIHHQTVRSGQRVYARNRDLVVTATVGAGAEVPVVAVSAASPFDASAPAVADGDCAIVARVSTAIAASAVTDSSIGLPAHQRVLPSLAVAACFHHRDTAPAGPALCAPVRPFSGGRS